MIKNREDGEFFGIRCSTRISLIINNKISLGIKWFERWKVTRIHSEKEVKSKCDICVIIMQQRKLEGASQSISVPKLKPGSDTNL